MTQSSTGMLGMYAFSDSSNLVSELQSDGILFSLRLPSQQSLAHSVNFIGGSGNSQCSSDVELLNLDLHKPSSTVSESACLSSSTSTTTELQTSTAAQQKFILASNHSSSWSIFSRDIFQRNQSQRLFGGGCGMTQPFISLLVAQNNTNDALAASTSVNARRLSTTSCNVSTSSNSTTSTTTSSFCRETTDVYSGNEQQSALDYSNKKRRNVHSLTASLGEKSAQISVSSTISKPSIATVTAVAVPANDLLPPTPMCEICEETFTDFKSLALHLRHCQHHKRYTCEECGEEFNQEINLKLHAALHTTSISADDDEGNVTLVCCECHRRFTRMASFRCHLTLHRVDDLVTCPICGEEFVYDTQLRQHCREMHDNDVDQRIPWRKTASISKQLLSDRLITAENVTSSSTTSSSVRFCKQCGFYCYDIKELKTHFEKHRKIRQSLRKISGKSKNNRNSSMRKLMRGLQSLEGSSRNNDDNCTTSSNADAELTTATTQQKRASKWHICSFCGKPFSKYSALKRHLTVHTGERPYACLTCNKRFQQLGSLKYHEATHMQDKPYKCQLCETAFAQRGNLRMHVLRVHPPLVDSRFAYPCPQCTCVFRSNQTLNAHMTKQHTPRQSSKMLADDVSVSTVLRDINGNDSEEIGDRRAETSALEALQALSADVEDVDSSGTSRLSNSLPVFTNDSNRAIVDVDHETTRKTSFHILDASKRRREMLSLNPIISTVKQSGETDCFWLSSIPPIQVRTVETFSNETGKRMHIERFFKCPYSTSDGSLCSLETNRLSTLVRHSRLHTGERPYKCRQCNRSFKVRSDMLNHTRSAHIGVKLAQCYICDRMLSNSYTLRLHVRRHLNQRTTDNHSRCHNCGRLFRSTVGLIRHRKRCCSSSSIKRNLTLLPPLDMRFSGNNNNTAGRASFDPFRYSRKRRFGCPHCLMHFVSNGHLRSHIRCKHSSNKFAFQCNFCMTSLSNASNLRAHIHQVHSGLRPYHCQRCHQSFGTNHSLLRHRRAVHDGVRPHKCPYCDKCFQQKSSCRRHIETHRAMVEKLLDNYRLETCGKPSTTFEDERRPILVQGKMSATDDQTYSNCHELSTALSFDMHQNEHVSAETLQNARIFPVVDGLLQQSGETQLSDHHQIVNSFQNNNILHATTAAAVNLASSSAVIAAASDVTSNSNVVQSSSTTLIETDTTMFDQGYLEQISSAIADIFTSDAISNLLAVEPSTSSNFVQQQQPHCNDIASVSDVAHATSSGVYGNENASLRSLVPVDSSNRCSSDSIFNSAAAISGMSSTKIITKSSNYNHRCTQCPRVFKHYSSLLKHQKSLHTRPSYDPRLLSPSSEIVDNLHATLERLETSSLPLIYSDSTSDNNYHNLLSMPAFSDGFAKNPAQFTVLPTRTTVNQRSQLIDSNHCFVALADGPPVLDISEMPATSSKSKNRSRSEQPSSAAAVIIHSSNVLEESHLNDELLTPIIEHREVNCGISNCDDVERNVVNTDDDVAICDSFSAEDVIKNSSIHALIISLPKDDNGYRRCPLCPKDFRKPSDLERHYRIHTGEKPYRCRVCVREFRVKSTLKQHMRIHDVDGSRGQQVEITCGICGNLFSTKSALKVHQRLHTNDRPFTCQQCGECFRTSQQCKLHATIHNQLPTSLKSSPSSSATKIKSKRRKAATTVKKLDGIDNTFMTSVSNSDVNVRLFDDVSQKMKVSVYPEGQVMVSLFPVGTNMAESIGLQGNGHIVLDVLTLKQMADKKLSLVIPDVRLKGHDAPTSIALDASLLLQSLSSSSIIDDDAASKAALSTKMQRFGGDSNSSAVVNGSDYQEQLWTTSVVDIKAQINVNNSKT